MKASLKLVHTFLVMPNRQTTKSYGLEIFLHTIILSEIYQMEGFSNQIKE